ncbi:MAG: hypothetical protein RL106_954 [Bacteroidota bacterium]
MFDKETIEKEKCLLIDSGLLRFIEFFKIERNQCKEQWHHDKRKLIKMPSTFKIKLHHRHRRPCHSAPQTFCTCHLGEQTRYCDIDAGEHSEHNSHQFVTNEYGPNPFLLDIGQGHLSNFHHV